MERSAGKNSQVRFDRTYAVESVLDSTSPSHDPQPKQWIATRLCPNGSRVGPASCWFNPGAFALPLPGQFGSAGRNSLRGPTFAEFDPSLEKNLQLSKSARITFGAEVYNLFNHRNFGVPSNTQSPLTLGGTTSRVSVVRTADSIHGESVPGPTLDSGCAEASILRERTRLSFIHCRLSPRPQSLLSYCLIRSFNRLILAVLVQWFGCRQCERMRCPGLSPFSASIYQDKTHVAESSVRTGAGQTFDRGLARGIGTHRQSSSI
jgi:hypothetical protein